MRVSDLMKTELAVVNEDASVAEAIVELADAHVHGVPVLDRRERIVGVLSSSDILQTAAESEGARRFDQMLVRDIMTTPPQTLGPDEDIKNAAQLMLELDVHRLFVEKDRELVGVIAQSDIVRALATGKL